MYHPGSTRFTKLTRSLVSTVSFGSPILIDSHMSEHTHENSYSSLSTSVQLFVGFICCFTEFQWRSKLAPRAKGVFLLPNTHWVVLLCLALTTYLWVSSASMTKQGVAVTQGISTFGWRGSLLGFSLHWVLRITKIKKGSNL